MASRSAIIATTACRSPKWSRHCWSDLPASDRPAAATRSTGDSRPDAVADRSRDDRRRRPGVLRVAEVIDVLRGLDQSRYSFVADVGDSWFIGLELRADVFVAAGYYSSMGFAVPAALGAGIAEPSRRPFVIVGDGAFQMTGTELATHVDLGLRPIVLLLNNGGYGMLEAIDRPRRYFERRELGLPGAGAVAGRGGRASLQPRASLPRPCDGPRRRRCLPHRGVHGAGRPLAGHGPDPHSCPFGVPDPARRL